MADWHFSKAESWSELLAVHARWVEDFNAQKHWAHRERADGRRSPGEVLSWVPGALYGREELDRAFFSQRFSRVLDALGYVVWRRWKVYGGEGLAGEKAALWLRDKTLTVEHAGEPLSRYEVEFMAGTDKPRTVARPVLFGTTIALSQPKLFGLDSLGEGGWLKALKLKDYVPRRPRPRSLQQTLFSYHEAWG